MAAPLQAVKAITLPVPPTARPVFHLIAQPRDDVDKDTGKLRPAYGPTAVYTEEKLLGADGDTKYFMGNRCYRNQRIRVSTGRLSGRPRGIVRAVKTLRLEPDSLLMANLAHATMNRMINDLPAPNLGGGGPCIGLADLQSNIEIADGFITCTSHATLMSPDIKAAMATPVAAPIM